MIKLWTWAPFPRTFSRHEDWEECLQYVANMIEDYEEFQNQFIRNHNERAVKHNMQFPKSKIEEKKEFEMTLRDVQSSITIFDTKINQTLMDWKKNGKATQVSAS